ncbi:MAG: replicative DNA helicase [Verrucomicrobia bacterium]|jgi:replicative DNA helicase|nr:replicative DNA helicase [Verrucomicrobiota bacterium]
MVRDSGGQRPATKADRIPPYSEEAERGVLGSILLDFDRALNLAVDSQITPDYFYVPAHRIIYEAMLQMLSVGQAIDVLTLADNLRTQEHLDAIGGDGYLDQLIDSTPTAAHAEYYIDIVRQKYLLRAVINCARDAETACYTGEQSADSLLSEVEQAFLNITENQHGSVTEWPNAVQEVMEYIESVFQSKRGIGSGISTGFLNIDRKLNGLRGSEMIVLAARPSMGKTSLAMNIAEHAALGKNDPDGKGHAVGIFSLEMSYASLVTRMLCCHAEVPGFQLSGGYVSTEFHGRIVKAASVLRKAPIFMDDTGGLDVMELRARARRMKKKHNIELIVIDYLQLLNCREYSHQGRQLETSAISSNLKAMAKELNLPVLVLSQLSRAPEQRDKEGRPKLSDLRDSGAIEQDADVVMMLRRPCKYPGTEGADDERLAIVDVVKQRNGPTGEVLLNFEDSYTRFRDRERGVDGLAEAEFSGEEVMT